ncbi:glucose-6-phosphate isomerase [Stella humosa]|uniref:Glucose-6-phosphate isomerase n=1 Tax=Stella humosa TaxID=94 RepID=A0A3N1LI39_9PROT|nr:glucose-6-phosphate isomerase [Stella humosa]ROP91012.1 glucose-6-phosphate isomerase [Stella humosa]BBK34638.1 glucose-6-phosphate isomerase [Stella humosa]
MIPFSIDDSTLLTDRVGPSGVDPKALAGRLADAKAALVRVRAMRDEGTLPLLALPGRRDDLEALEKLAARMRKKTSDVLVLGTGGSSLGGQTLYALADQGFGPPKGIPRIHFLDNIDPATFAALADRIDFTRTRILAISKSGGTAETLMQLLTLLPRLEKAVERTGVADRLVVVTEPADNPLRRLGTRLGATILDHDPGVGGRFSVLSLVGLLPALIAGLDAGKVRAGAKSVLDAALAAETPADCAPLRGAALNLAHAEAGRATTVLMPYLDRLAHFGMWFRQLWAESLGKDGKGTTPIRAMGTVDQHSQLQLYLAGPADKIFTLITLAVAGKGDKAAAAFARDPALGYLKGRRMGDLLDAEQRATGETLVRNGRPTRIFRLERLDEKSMGALFMHFMLETIFAAQLLGIDAFDQPAVEEGKKLARAYLAES